MGSEQMDQEVCRIVDAARELWIRRLVDHSRANSLLFYRDLKVGTLDLSGRPEAVRRLLAGEALGVEALLPPPLAEAESNPVSRERERAEARSQVRRALVAIQRKALGNLEEKGIETLFLADGMATWPATDGGRPYEAPVLLVPARIESRGRSGEDIRLIVAGEPQLNSVLLFVLEETFRIRLLPDSVLQAGAAEDESGRWAVDPDSVFRQIEREAGGTPHLRIDPRVVLGNFQFAKMAMVEDLRRNGDAMAANPIIAAIAGHRESRRRLAQAVSEIEPAALDERPAADDYLVLDADSTQQRAIVLVSMEQNAVIQGPPGTGKSQTIANLIAQSVAEGRRVLFVAEKRAALEAVIKRLNHPDVGLGHLVLDLHGASVSRKDVMARLASSLEHIRHAPPVDGADSVHHQFESRRRRLNEHARRVNALREPAGLSVNQLLGRLLRLPEAAKSSFRLRGQPLAALDPQFLDEVRQWVRDGAARATLVLGTDASPWNDAEIRDGVTAQLMLDDIVRTADERWPRFRTLLDAVVRQTGVQPPPTLDAAGALLNVLRDARCVSEHYDAAVFEARPDELAEKLGASDAGALGRLWAFLIDGDYRAARSRLRSLRSAPAPVPVLLHEARHAADVLRRWRDLGPANETPRKAESAAELGDAWITLREALVPIERVVKGGPFGGMAVGDAGERIRSLARDQQTPYQLPEAHAIRDRLRQASLAGLLDDLREHSVAPEHWMARLEYVWLYSTLETVLACEPALAAFSGRAHEQLIADFARCDQQRVRLAAERVRRLAAERAVEAMDQHYEQADLVRKEVSKRSRHIPLRELLARAPDVLTRIAPCWVASPLSVSHLLDGGQRHFDLVIFDEASQVLQEEAVPSLYRARQVVVAGDRHQLPPTTFFATEVEGEDEISGGADAEAQRATETATDAIGGFESILDTLGAFLPNRMLEWHYRSQDERLIAFSNEHIYDRQLVTFPSARAHQAIRHLLVLHDPSLGTQEESASREVDEVVRLVIEHAELRPHESLGVITMGIRHANRVLATLDWVLEFRTDLAGFFALEKEERFFVKNLETVQGDERDAIILTVGYGKTASGDLPHRFGPLTQETGYRRLNVAVTRARRRMTVVSSFSHHEVDLERSGSRGVQLLKAYLEFAASGGTRLPEGETAGEVAPNAFEADVRDALKARGIHTRPQFGASRYRIDLVAMHPDKPGRPVLAIECDGASYHSAATARDRDRLRQAHLMRLGWRFHRIWSTDWFYSREQEVERAVAAYERAVEQVDHEDVGQERANAARPVPSPAHAEPLSQTLQRGPLPQVPERDSIEQYSDRELQQIVEWVVSDGLLRTEAELVREAFALLPFRRLGSRIELRLRAVVQTARHRLGRGELA